MRTLMIAVPVILLLLTTGVTLMQDTAPANLTHQFIINFPGQRKDSLFEKILKWMENNLRSPRPVIEKEDLETGTIAGNGVTEMRAEGDTVDVRLAFVFRVDVRDGKARFRFTNLEVSPDEESGWDPMPEDTTWHRPAQVKFTAMIGRLTEYVNK
ncbi:MAG: DUF4468 domain-containing protein [Bacteroidota bacterium]